MGIDCCKYCGKNIKLCKAHIVPKAFFQAIKRLDSDNFLYVHDAKNTYEYRTSIGLWDNHILCSKCDNELGIYDNNFFTYLTTTNFEIFRKELHSYYYYQLYIDSEIYLYTKLFFASLLYRASLSQINFSRNVDLGGRYEEVIKDFIKYRHTDISELSIIPMKLYSSRIDPRKTLSDIYKQRIDGINGYAIVLYGFKFWIKVDKRPVPKVLDMFTLQEGEVLIPADEFEKTSDYRVAVELAKKFHNKR